MYRISMHINIKNQSKLELFFFLTKIIHFMNIYFFNFDSTLIELI